MKYLIVLLIVIAALAWWLSRRGSTGLGGTRTETTEKALGQSRHGDGPGGTPGFGGGA